MFTTYLPKEQKQTKKLKNSKTTKNGTSLRNLN